jgi:hypothetical protein
MVFVGTAGCHTQREYSLQELAAEGLITFQAQLLQAQSLPAKLRGKGIDRYRLGTVSSIGVIIHLVESSSLRCFGSKAPPRNASFGNSSDRETRANGHFSSVNRKKVRACHAAESL